MKAPETHQGPAARRPARARHARDMSRAWLRAAAAGLTVLAAAAAAVSFSAQYRMVDDARGLPVIAGLEAAIPDAAALVFACLGIALALHGRRALRARFLNVAAVGTSVFMNAIAAGPGWRAGAIWVMPPVAYALASDTLIGVVRATVTAADAATRTALADDEGTPLTMVGALARWLLRLAVAPASTLAGLRAWVLAECPAAPRRRAPRPGTSSESPEPRPVRPTRDSRRPGTKTARFLALARDQHGPLAGIPLSSVAPISRQLAPAADLDPGAARTALRRAVLAAQNPLPVPNTLPAQTTLPAQKTRSTT